MKTNTKNTILKLLKKKQLRPHDISNELGISSVMTHRHLKQLISDDLIEKKGSPPIVFYTIKQKTTLKNTGLTVKAEDEKFLNKHYLYVSPEGKIIEGPHGFLCWAQKTKQKNIAGLVAEYIKTRKQINNHVKKNRIDATDKIQKTFDKKNIKKVFYQDFYAIPKFGKTKLGQLVLYAKQSQNKKMMYDVAKEIKPTINGIIKDFKINAVAFIPHSIPRETPFLNILKKQLNLSIPHIKLVKAYSGEIPVAQKSLSKLEDRIINAKNTIMVFNKSISNSRVLLIDDAVGSGSTLYETAKKLKMLGVKKIYGYAIVGSYKGFEVIKEV